MGDKAKKKNLNKVAFYDFGIDKTIKDFVGIKFYELAKTPDEDLQEYSCRHATAVFDVFHHTFNSLRKKHDAEIKDVMEIIDYSILNESPPEEGVYENYQAHISFCTNTDNNVLSKIFPLAPNTLNISMGLSLADYNIKSAMPNTSNLLKNNRQKGIFIAVGAGNEGGAISSNDIFPQNNLYIFTVGAIYPKDYKKPKDLLIASDPYFQLSLSTPSTGIILSALGTPYCSCATIPSYSNSNGW